MDKTEKAELQSMDVAADKRRQLAQLFPEVVTETRTEDGQLVHAVDFEKLKGVLGEFSEVLETSGERYGMTWPGKNECLKIIQQPSVATLKPCRKESVNFDETENVFIEGDNLEVLKLLQKAYYGKVKMIYIDPPYNGGGDLIYPDDYSETLETYLSFAGLLGDEGRRLHSNTKDSGRYHTKWLRMMYPRLYLARNLLREDGVAFISIDDNEAAHLKLLCDYIFGEESYCVTLYLQVRYSGKTLTEKNDYQKLIEKVLVYSRPGFQPIKHSVDYNLNKFEWKITEKAPGEPIELGGRAVTIFKEGEYEIERVPASIDALKETWATGTVLKANASGKFFHAHLAPRRTTDGLKCLYKVDGVGEDGLGFRYFTGPRKATATKGKFYSGVPLTRREELGQGTSKKELPIENFRDFADAFGNCRHEGQTDFRSGKKPVAFLRHLLDMAATPDEEALVCDFFAGSCSLAHAVVAANVEDKGNRRFLCVQLPEELPEEEAQASGVTTVSALGRKRIKTILSEYRENLSSEALFDTDSNGAPDFGMRAFSLDRSNFRLWDGSQPDDPEKIAEQLELHEQHIDPNATPEDILYELLLKAGFPLTTKVEKAEMVGKEVFSISEGTLLICLQDEITTELIKAMADANPLQVICLDSGFKNNDQLKANAVQTFKVRNRGKDKESSIVFRTV